MHEQDHDDFFGRDAALPEDPHTTQEGGLAQQRGQGAMASSHRGDKGHVTGQFPGTHTYTVQTERSGVLHGVQRIAQAPSDKRMLPVGAQVCITHDFGPPMILGVLNFTAHVEAEDAPASLTGVGGIGADDGVHQANGDGNYRPAGTPRDLGPDDWAEVSPAGNAVAVLDGGVNVMKSSDLAQVRTHALNDLVEIMSSNFRHVTSMGYSEIRNNGGRTSYVFRGGTDQLHEAGSDQENWTIRLDAGGTGDLLNLELTKPSGTTVFKLHVTPDGKADIYAAEGFHWKNGAQTTSKTLGDEITEVKGAASRTVGGEDRHTVGGRRATKISGNDTRMVGNDSVLGIVRHLTQSVGGDAKYKYVGGSPATAKPTNTALEYEIVNGSWKVNIGDTLSAASPAALAGFDLRTKLGDISLQATTKGNVTLETTVGEATLNTNLGRANVDGTTVHLGNKQVSPANPIIRGTVYTSAMSTYLTANSSTYSALNAATTAASTLLGFGFPKHKWSIASSVVVAWLSALTGALSALAGTSNTLNGQLPGTLSRKAFTE